MQSIRSQPHTRLDAQYIAALSHDLRAPLTNISHALQRLQTVDAQMDRPEYQRIWWNLQQINRMIENQLDYARLEQRQNAFQLETIDVIPWLREYCNNLQREASWYQIELLYYSACGSAILHCDQVKLERCLLNLFSNALSHTPREGLITISAEIQEPELRIRVDDTGSGMEQRMVRDLMSSLGKRRRMHKLKLYQEAYGLSVVKAFAQGMHGRITLESALGEGTSVSLWFQLAR